VELTFAIGIWEPDWNAPGWERECGNKGSSPHSANTRYTHAFTTNLPFGSYLLRSSR
jgi:hypothetical protein